MKLYLPAWVLVLALLGGLAWTGFLARNHLAGVSSIMDRFESVLLDMRILASGSRKPPSDVTVVAIDDATVSALGQYPLKRGQLGALIDRIRASGARAIAVDILFNGQSAADEDTALGLSLAAMPSVIAAAGQFQGQNTHRAYVPIANRVLAPLSKIAAQSSVGLVNIVQDPGGTPRHIPLIYLVNGQPEPSFALRAAGYFMAEDPIVAREGIRFGDRLQLLDLGWHLALNYYGPAGTVPTISALDVFSDPAAADLLRGRLAVLGVTATAVGDRFNTPFDPIMPGVEVQATGIANLLDGSPLRRDLNIRRIDVAAAVTVMLTGMLAVLLLPLAPASLLYLAILTVWLATTVFVFRQGIWLNAALPIAASLPPVAAIGILRQVTDRYQARRIQRARDALGRFQSPLLAHRIAEDPVFLIAPKQQIAPILFLDLSGYTGLSERIGPAQTRDYLKQFHTIVVNEAAGFGGVVLDFMGDGAMLGFGIPDPAPTDAARAMQCAFALTRATTSWIVEAGLQPDITGVRVGLHMGPVVLSRLGHESQQQIAATGDCVNVASRLLDLAKERGAAVAISSAVLAEVPQSMRSGHRSTLETTAIRGRQQPLEVAIWTMAEIASMHSNHAGKGPVTPNDMMKKSSPQMRKKQSQ
ncbi:CHASE2 domain-containing protein [Roseibium sp. RKSG952]|uniref:CHASE2 domain-containing protein n=1 Tax=Roseibium sp. RKSG952 TaxID=2529384 RepID=UPI0012BD2B49|nr:adenylate/guanylate cyclase domain-containing protein [Roseibium sp. RKSG952]MTI00660.1 adenylate/guanylate cyclase domain-containing protein [Roseibium sp. RKSG952]